MAGLFKRDYTKKGHPLNLADALIAATAIHNNFPLLTDDTKDFPMPEITLYPLPK